MSKVYVCGIIYNGFECDSTDQNQGLELSVYIFKATVTQDHTPLLPFINMHKLYTRNARSFFLRRSFGIRWVPKLIGELKNLNEDIYLTKRGSKQQQNTQT